MALNSTPAWALNFSKYLDAFGFDYAPLAWGLSQADLSDDQHDDLIDILTKE
jgi:hypothetical protein